MGFAVQAGAEEILFRGWLLSVLARKFNVAAGVALTSIVFMLGHYGPHQHWLVTVGTFAFSTFTCFWAIRAGNLWSVMGWHAGWNWLLAPSRMRGRLRCSTRLAAFCGPRRA